MKLGTFSIVGRCERTGQLGVATSTAALAGGAFVPHALAGVAAVATQAYTNPYLALAALGRLATGTSPERALEAALAADTGRELRQVLIVDSAGQVAAHTGADVPEWAGHIIGEGFVAGGNTLAGPDVIGGMGEAFRSSAGEALGERLVRALEAAQAAGGDRRGKQSAALYVVGHEDYGHADLRVDDHEDPVREMRRLWNKFRVELEPYLPLFPTKARPAGETSLAVWEGAATEPVKENNE